MTVKRPVSASLAKAFFYIVLLSILSTGSALLTLTSSLRDAEAINIAVSCVTAPDGDHTVYIRDNGIGIGEPHEPAGHYGLNIMRERAERLGGTLNFSQPSGGGTLVSISFRSSNKEESQLT